MKVDSVLCWWRRPLIMSSKLRWKRVSIREGDAIEELEMGFDL